MRARGLALAFTLAVADVAHAHGFGQRYDLPLPLALYICGAALTVVASCVMFAICIRAVAKDADYPRFDLLSTRVGRALSSPLVIALLRLVAVAIYLFVIFAGFAGEQNAFKNIVPVTVWALWWVGLAYFSALIGDLWKLVNPLETIFAAMERAFRLASPRRAWPAAAQSWPAVALYLVFLGLEIAWEGSDTPSRIALVIVLYSLLTWAGMWLFGREAWLAHGEVFTRVFGVLARFSPIHIGLTDRRVTEWHLRPYAVGLVPRAPLDASGVALVLVILAAVSFDGFLETPAWAALVEGFAPEHAALARTVALVVAPLLFAAVYLAFCQLIAIGGRNSERGAYRRVAGLFVLTLVPIAIAYEIAHYLSFLVQAGQYLVPLASDPLGWKWNLFGTANHFVRPAILDARLIWIVSVVAIVAGHVAALYLGHVVSLREFADRRAAVRSQGPMLVLMVGYTMLSLWIIAQPIVNSR
jgi:hypothetical protein